MNVFPSEGKSKPKDPQIKAFKLTPSWEYHNHEPGLAVP